MLIYRQLCPIPDLGTFNFKFYYTVPVPFDRAEERMSAIDLHRLLESPPSPSSSSSPLLVDVRAETEFEMCSLKGSVNWPIQKLLRCDTEDRLLYHFPGEISGPVVLLCRRGE